MIVLVIYCSATFRLTNLHSNSLHAVYIFSNNQECDCGPSVPVDIQRAVQEHLKKRKFEQPVFESSQQLNIQQQRELVKRESGVSVWKLVLPRYHGRGADPIVEYRNSHRILFVKKMPEVSRE